jgi:hypothetical protein
MRKENKPYRITDGMFLSRHRLTSKFSLMLSYVGARAAAKIVPQSVTGQQGLAASYPHAEKVLATTRAFIKSDLRGPLDTKRLLPDRTKLTFYNNSYFFDQPIGIEIRSM